MKLVAPPLLFACALAISQAPNAFAAPTGATPTSAAQRGCSLGRQQIEALKKREHGGLVILSRDPVSGYDAVAWSLGREMKNRVPSELRQVWKQQTQSNLFDLCPDLAEIPGVRLSNETDDVLNVGSQKTVYYFSAPVVDRSGNQALFVEGFYCSGRCGGYAINHYRWDGMRWERLKPLFSIHG